MLEYMLDTDTVSFALRGEGHVANHLLQQRPSRLCISSITLAELCYGAEMKRSWKLHRLINTFVQTLTIAPFEGTAANHFGSIAAWLARRGMPIGGYDTLIGAHALALGLTLVTNNIKHFKKIPGLNIENWVLRDMQNSP